MSPALSRLLAAAVVLLTACTESSVEDSTPSTSSAPAAESTMAATTLVEIVRHETHGYSFAAGFAVGLENDTGTVVAIDVATGSTAALTTIQTGDRTLGRIQLGQNGTDIYFEALMNEHYLSCTTSHGEIVRLNLLTGATETIGAGREPHISPDGTRLAYRAASTCLPDASGSVHTPTDTLVVVDLASGTESRWLDPWLISRSEDADFDFLEAEPRGLAWIDNEHVQVGSTVVTVVDGSRATAQCSLTAEAGTNGRYIPIGIRRTTDVIVFESHRRSDEAPDGVLFEQACHRSAMAGSIAHAEEELIAALDRSGVYLLLVIDGRTLVFGDDEVELDRRIDNVDW